MGGILGGVVMVVVGFLLIYKTSWFVENFGRIPFFEKHMGTFGGSYLAYKVFGLLFCFFGILTMTGLTDNFLNWSLGRVFRRGGIME